MSARKVTVSPTNTAFLAALGVLTVLIVVNFLVLNARVRSQESVAAVVNVSGRQRMLSQRTALLAQDLVLAEDPMERAGIRRDLLAAISLFNRSHRGLTQGDPQMGLPGDLPPAARAIYFNPPTMLNEQFQQYVRELILLTELPDDQLTPDTRCLQHIHTAASSGTLLDGLDAAVKAYQEDSEAKVARLELLTWWVTGSTLVAAAITFWFAFLTLRGEIRLCVSLEQALCQIRQARDELEARVQVRTAELTRSNEQLEQFAYVVSHDLKAPLRAISSLATWVAEDYTDAVDEEGRENLQLLISRVQRMNDLIEGILRYSRAGRQSPKLELLNTGEIVRNDVELLAPPADVDVRIDGTLPEIVFDRTQFEQVIQNLLSNSFKHLGKSQGEIVVSCCNDGAFWQFSVRDDGVGIPEQHFDRIFELFQTLKPRDELEATGVGLAVVKQIVERHGGEVTVKSTVGEGSEFTFTIPEEVLPGKIGT
ncbi:MAG: ATP-binding protein [Pirellulaceae bacterium]